MTSHLYLIRGARATRISYLLVRPCCILWGFFWGPLLLLLLCLEINLVFPYRFGLLVCLGGIGPLSPRSMTALEGVPPLMLSLFYSVSSSSFRSDVSNGVSFGVSVIRFTDEPTGALPSEKGLCEAYTLLASTFAA